VRILGILQPLNDAIKLFIKEQINLIISNYLIFYFSPVFALFIALLVWICIPYFIKLYSFHLGLLFFICCIRLRVYIIISIGWSSNSNYSLLGRLRSIAQTISYEVSLRLILISFIILIIRFNLTLFLNYQEYIWFLFIRFPLILSWLSISLAETNRAPFDFAEGESELVSGFNVEYRRGGFALIFLAEYISILLIRIIISILFIGGDIQNIKFYIKLVFISYIFIWVRGSFPRFRYDKLIYLAWKKDFYRCH